MDRERPTSGNGHARAAGPALGSVARDVMDHAAMIGRDFLKIGQLEARRYAEHLRRDVARKAGWGAAAAIVGAAAVVCGLIALFWGIATAIGSVAWTFAIFCGFFAASAVVMAALASRPAERDVSEEIAHRFPAAKSREGQPEHLLLSQQVSSEGHRRAIEEARREALFREGPEPTNGAQRSRTPTGGSTSLAAFEAPRKT